MAAGTVSDSDGTRGGDGADGGSSAGDPTAGRRAVRLRDGVHFELGGRVVADARSAVGDVNVVSHAHADHLPRGGGSVVCSDATAALVEARTGRDVNHAESAPGVDLFPAGHIVGSRAARIESGGRRYLYTGDVSTRDRLSLSGFDPVDADELVVESRTAAPSTASPTSPNWRGASRTGWPTTPTGRCSCSATHWAGRRSSSCWPRAPRIAAS